MLECSSASIGQPSMAKTNQTHSVHTILRRREVERRVGLGRSSIYALIADGSFPEPIKLSKHAVGWIETEINSWLDKRIRASRPETQGGAQ
jgi:prophage regulatory protein